MNISGLRLHYLDWDSPDNETLVLLHGISGVAHSWDRFASAAQDRYRVLALDQRGHGDSDWSPDAAYAVGDFLSDLSGFVDALGMERFALMGHSMGGRIALRYAFSNPGRVTRLVVADIGPEVGPKGMTRLAEDMSKSREEFSSLEEVVAEIRHAHPYASDETLRHEACHLTKELPNGRIVWKRDRAAQDMVLMRKKASSSPDLWACLPQIRCPTLIVRGAASDILAPDVARRMQQTLPDGKLVEIEEAGHGVFVDNPNHFEAVVWEFLDA